MKKLLIYSALLFATLLTRAQTVTITQATGWLESAYVKWNPVSGASSYNVYYTGGGFTNKPIDTQLIRSYGSYLRADIPGLAAGSYTIKVAPVIGGSEGTATTSASITVLAQDRNGFAHSGGYIPGAYNLNGTLKSNAVVLYITQNTKNTVSLTVTGATTNPCVGLQTILDAFKKGQDTRPLDVRLIGNITDLSYMLNGDLVIENKNITAGGITFEGIGSDAVANGWGLRIKNGTNIEVRNLGFMLTDADEGDNVGLQQNNDHVWVHNCDMFYGKPGGDADQAKGDGALDCKKSTYVTFSFNHFWDNGKCNLLGLSENTTTGLYITYHHNWYDHSDSRHPRVRFYSAHIYNNYFDGNSKYGSGSTEGSSLFVEGNVFRNCKYPMLTSMQGTDIYYGTGGTFSSEDGGFIKAYNNDITGATRFVAYNASTYPVEFDAFVATTRNQVVSSSIKSKQGNNTYNNFDTNTSLYVNSLVIDSPQTAKTKTMQYSGRVSGGDISWTFSNSGDDTSDSVNSGLMSLLTSYASSLVSVQGDGTQPGSGQTLTASNNSQTVTSGTAISSMVFTWGGTATDATVSGLPASGITYVKNTTAKTITVSGTPTASISFTVTTSGSSGTPVSATGSITVNAAPQTLSVPSNNSQTVQSGTAISSMVFTWGGSATDASVSGLPASGITFVKNTTAKTITVSGTPTASISFTVTTSGSTAPAATGSGSITVTAPPSGSQIHNFTTSGLSSTFYSFSNANMNSTPGSTTYDGLTLTARMKVESSTNVAYTTTQTSTLTLVFDPTFSGAIKLDGVSYNASSGVAVITAVPAGTHNITKNNVANLYYIKTVYGSSRMMDPALVAEAGKPVLYPSPMGNELNISHDGLIEEVTIYNLMGQIVKTITGNAKTIDVSGLSGGSYLVKVRTVQGTTDHQVIKQ